MSCSHFVANSATEYENNMENIEDGYEKSVSISHVVSIFCGVLLPQSDIDTGNPWLSFSPLSYHCCLPMYED